MDTRQQGKPPRQWAAEIVDAWIDGRPTEPITSQLPPHLRDYVRDIVRGSTMIITAHARRPLPSYSRKLVPLQLTVARYKQSRGIR